MISYQRAKENKITPGIAIKRTIQYIKQDEKNKSDTRSDDTKNRQYLVNKGIAYLKEGKNIEQALDLIMEDEVITNFEYLTKNGLDIRTCIKNWINIDKNRKKFENRGQERE